MIETALMSDAELAAAISELLQPSMLPAEAAHERETRRVVAMLETGQREGRSGHERIADTAERLRVLRGRL